MVQFLYVLQMLQGDEDRSGQRRTRRWVLLTSSSSVRSWPPPPPRCASCSRYYYKKRVCPVHTEETTVGAQIMRHIPPLPNPFRQRKSSFNLSNTLNSDECSICEFFSCDAWRAVRFVCPLFWECQPVKIALHEPDA